MEGSSNLEKKKWWHQDVDDLEVKMKEVLLEAANWVRTSIQIMVTIVENSQRRTDVQIFKKPESYFCF